MNNSFFKVSNNFNVSEKKSMGPNNYFKQCINKDVKYGSERPIKEKCPEITNDNSSVPCNSIWNNLTRRKTLVEY
tara:strand:- start:273 stop:497 length:225 start_codon:yes stop_codon:yes gene_type:complete